MLKKIDDYIQQKINKSLQEKENVLEKTGRFFLPETDRGELLARSLQKTQKDITPIAPNGAVMDALNDGGAKLNSSYAIYGQVDDVIYTHFALQGFIGFQACAILTQNWLINKCCALPPKDAMAPDYDISYKDKDVLDCDKELLLELKTISDSKTEFSIKGCAREFAEKKRQFGVSYAYPIVAGAKYDKPFKLDAVKPNSYKGMVNVDPYWLSPELDLTAASDVKSAEFYEPTWYKLPNGTKIHKSWIVKSVNGNIPDILKPTYYYGGYPIPQLIYQRVYAAESVANEAPMLAKSKRLLYMDGNLSNYVLNQSKAENDAKAFSYFRDNWGVVVKRPDQAIGQIDTSLTDFDSVLMSQYQLVAAASGVHATKLLETQPKGFNTSGAFEEAQYNSLLLAIEKEDYKPYLNVHYMLLLKSKYNKNYTIDCEFKPIDTPSIKEVAEYNEIKSRTNASYLMAGVISKNECRETLRLDPDSGFNMLSGDAPEAPDKQSEHAGLNGKNPTNANAESTDTQSTLENIEQHAQKGEEPENKIDSDEELSVDKDDEL